MRVTNTLFYTNSVAEHQSAMKKMYDVDKQIASGLKIQNSYEDSGIYVDAMRLNYEIATLEQTKETSAKGQTFAQNTDSTMNQIEEALEQFKTKLIQANSSVHSSTSLNAIADELEGLKTHLLSLGNTSINGQFIFSGSSLLQKPLNSEGVYVGNGESLKALIGSGVELPYNINGQSLFLGTDNDYSRVISTNLEMLNQSKLNPNVMTEEDGNLVSSEVYLSENDTIRDLVGDTNAISADDPKAVFYLSGRKGDGTTFAKTIQIDTNSKVSDLLENIGTAYGNTASNKVVDVTMNVRGQIEVKDLNLGKQILEMNIFGAIDRNAPSGTVGDALQIMNSDNLTLKPNVDIIAFNKSNFLTTQSSPDLTIRSTPLGAGTYSLDFPNTQSIDATNITTTTSLIDLFPADVDHLDFNGTSFPITGETVQDLIDELNVQFGPGTASFNNDKIQTNLDITIVPKNVLNSLARGNDLPDAMNYARRGFEKNGNELTSNISQVIKLSDEFATASTKLIEVAGVSSLNGKQLVLEFTDKNGTTRTGTLNLDSLNTTFSIDLNGNGTTNVVTGPPFVSTDDLNEIIPIYNGKGDLDNLSTKADEMTYQQLMDIVSMVVSGNIPQKGVNEEGQDYIDTFVTAAVPASPGASVIANALGVSSKTAQYIQKAIDFGIERDIAIALPDPAAAVIAQKSYNDAIANANIEEYNYALNTTKSSVDVNLDYKGRIAILDKTTSESKIEFTMYDKSATDFTGISSTALSFMANDSVTISNPSIDFFNDLDMIIDSVRTGQYRMDGNSKDPRNTGMQNALSQLDHILDHVTKEHTKIGAYSNALSDANERAEYLSLNVKTVRSEIIDVDIAEAYLQFNQISNSYQAMLSTIAKINSMSLLNYM
jgi:flagellar hook-associated protein 3 FlgL